MALVELTNAYDDTPLAIDHASIGLVKVAAAGKLGAELVHRGNCRRRWWVREPYATVVARIREAEARERGQAVAP